MPSVYDILQGVVGMQRNAQANVPVIPNNGNPQGANNMPAAAQAPVVPPAAADKYPWLNPSPYMAQVQQLLARPIMAGYQGPMPGTQEFRDARAAGETPIRDYRQQQLANGMPVLPMPGNTGVVGPMGTAVPHTMAAPSPSVVLPERRRDTNPIIVR